MKIEGDSSKWTGERRAFQFGSWARPETRMWKDGGKHRCLWNTHATLIPDTPDESGAGWEGGSKLWVRIFGFGTDWLVKQNLSGYSPPSTPYEFWIESMLLIYFQGMYIRALQRNRTDRIYRRFIMRNWLVWLWRLRSLSICKLESQDGRWWNSSPSPKAWEPLELSLAQGQGETHVPAQQSGRKETILIASSFCSIWVFSGLDGAYPHWGRQSTCVKC